MGASLLSLYVLVIILALRSYNKTLPLFVPIMTVLNEGYFCDILEKVLTNLRRTLALWKLSLVLFQYETLRKVFARLKIVFLILLCG